ncbi:MAG: CRISPR-associated endonuclease Cas2 [Acidobacteriota bacterium]
MELQTLVIYDVEDDWARLRVAEACKDFGLERIQYSCFRGPLSRNKREELYERMRKVQRDWEKRWRRDFPGTRVEQSDFPEPPQREPQGRWTPAFKIMIQPICEKDWGATSYAYLFLDLTGELDLRLKQSRKKKRSRPAHPPVGSETASAPDGAS